MNHELILDLWNAESGLVALGEPEAAALADHISKYRARLMRRADVVTPRDARLHARIQKIRAGLDKLSALKLTKSQQRDVRQIVTLLNEFEEIELPGLKEGIRRMEDLATGKVKGLTEAEFQQDLNCGEVSKESIRAFFQHLRNGGTSAEFVASSGCTKDWVDAVLQEAVDSLSREIADSRNKLADEF